MTDKTATGRDAPIPDNAPIGEWMRRRNKQQDKDEADRRANEQARDGYMPIKNFNPLSWGN